MPQIEEWDFDLCPTPEFPPDQHVLCLYYEYGLDSEKVVESVRIWRNEDTRLRKERNPALRAQHGINFGLPFSVLSRIKEFPSLYWLQIPLDRRKSITSQLSPYFSELLQSIGSYRGPSASHLAALNSDAAHIWPLIKEEKRRIDESFDNAHREGHLRNWPDVLYSEFAEEDYRRAAQEYHPSLRSAKGSRLLQCANQLRLELHKVIERRYRPKLEVIAYEVDWSKTYGALTDDFARWLRENRVHSHVGGKVGHHTTSLERLKALGAERLAKFFSKSRRFLPQRYLECSVEDGVLYFTRTERERARRKGKSLYRDRSGIGKAVKTATETRTLLYPSPGKFPSPPDTETETRKFLADSSVEKCHISPN